ncbi:MAG: RecQ family ATP-dependent DNA helicase [Gemmatimonadota bacterium]
MSAEDRLPAARAVLASLLGHSDFRPAQARVVRAMLARRDVLAVLPTGAGKSVCFQVPALLEAGITVVVSPLISLMDDQVVAVRRRGFPAAALTSLSSPSDRGEVARALASRRLKLLYVSPERLATGAFRRLLGGCSISRVAVDEAHCISEWGHDFRPAYRRIATFCAAMGRPPVAAFTATATPATRADIEASLVLRDSVKVVGHVDRPNLWWGVETARSLAAGACRVMQVVRRTAGAGIVYLPTRERASRLAEALIRTGVPAVPYHAGLSADARRSVQQGFLASRHRVVCATNAFGMGIDHAHVRFVCHLGVPGSLEAYVQEAGRAGRDGGRARCLLLSCPGDFRLQRGLAASKWPSPRLLSAVWESMPAGRAISVAEVRERLGRRAAEEPVGAALRLLIEQGCARRARPTGAPDEEAVVRGPASLRRRIDFSAPSRGRARAAERLEAMRRYLRRRDCRRAMLAAYFGQPAPSCAGCDSCDARRRPG